ncbi:MAG: glycosyltransferase [Hyphomicrobiales bacterium]
MTSFNDPQVLAQPRQICDEQFSTHEHSPLSRTDFAEAYANIPSDIRHFFVAAEIPEMVADRAVARSQKWRSSLHKSISLERNSDEALQYWNLAKALGVPYCADPVSSQTLEAHNLPSTSITQTMLSRQRWNSYVDRKKPTRFVIAPEAETWHRLIELIGQFPELRDCISLTSPAHIRRAATRHHRISLLKSALNHLENILPGQSANTVVTSLQAAFALMFVIGFLFCYIALPVATHFMVTLFFAIFFFGCVSLRVLACITFYHDQRAEPPPLANCDLPKYTVLVPLYKEASIAPQLIKNLQELDYPPDLLDIKIILEEGDTDTVAAVQRNVPGAPFDVILVPDSRPKTKPKALNYALNFAEGDLVCIYDAEDRPDADQLRRAAAVLLHNSDVGAVQCSLTIKNGDESWFSRLFAIEYEALFVGLLPALDVFSMPMPLGGTSNHFRKSVLETTGAWDPFNVTEDADLGIRLARHGYRSTTLTSATTEEAPISFAQWLPQRTRWFKGWIQSWLVHMRNPVRLYQDLGVTNFCVAQIIMGGMFLSAALHPVFAILVFADLIGLFDSSPSNGLLDNALYWLTLFNFLAGYTASMLLSTVALIASGKTKWLPGVLHLPFYWWLMSVAAWRALAQLCYDPFKWEKTDHGISKISN